MARVEYNLKREVDQTCPVSEISEDESGVGMQIGSKRIDQTRN